MAKNSAKNNLKQNSNPQISNSVEDYLKAIWITAQDGAASTNALAEQLNIAAPSVSAMLGKLQDLEFVVYERYKGVSLTTSGKAKALELLRRHRLIETFLFEHFDYSWDEVHEDAEQLEHAVSNRFMERLAVFLDHPTHDPHGDPIPCVDGVMPDTPNTALAEVEVGEQFIVARLLSQASDVLSYLAKIGIQPGTELNIVDVEPLGGLVHVLIDKVPQAISKELAMIVRGSVKTSIKTS